jgi:hypothetical protein
MALMLSDVEGDFRRQFEKLDDLTPHRSWQALLAQAQRPVARTRTMHSADDYVAFDVSRPNSDRVSVSLERRVARFTDPYDYEGTMVFGCYLTLGADGWSGESVAPQSFEGHVTAYARVDGADDRPPLKVFRAEVETSAAFHAFNDSRILSVRIAAFQA